MGFLDRFTKKDGTKGGLTGSAVLRAKTPGWTSHDYSPDSLLNPSSPYQLDLEVKVDPDDSERILIDWDALAAAGGKAIVADHKSQTKRDAVKRAVSQNPMIRQADQAAVEDLLGEVKAGRRSVKELHGVVDDYVAGGSLTVEEGEAYKARAAS